MKKLFSISMACLFLFSCKGFLDDVDIPSDSIIFDGTSYEVSFFDDFSGTELDSAKWQRCPEWNRGKCTWKKDCSYVKNGNLVLECKRIGDSNFSGAVRSRNLFEQKYGLYKIRFKAEKTSGLWYAIWLMTDDVVNQGNGAKDGGEIDIAEIITNPNNSKKYIGSAVHWDYGENMQSHGSKYFVEDSFFDEWHILTFEWTPNHYKAYLDDTPTPFWDSTIEGADAWGGIVDVKTYLKLTCEFGDWAGALDKKLLPAHLYIDWIKVYK